MEIRVLPDATAVASEAAKIIAREAGAAVAAGCAAGVAVAA